MDKETEKAIALQHLKNTVSYVVQALKTRDPDDPTGGEKENTEKRLTTILSQVLAKQQAIVKKQLEDQYSKSKSIIVPPGVYIADWDEEDIQKLINELLKAAREGIGLFRFIRPAIDFTLTNIEAAKWARNYAYELIKMIDEVTRKAIQEAISMFVETPGFSIGDIVGYLFDIFSPARAQRIAITETTRAYAQGQQMAGEALKKEFPDIRVTKTWYTNRDDRVCPVCGPMDNKEVDIDKEFAENISNPPAHVNCRCWTDSRTRIGDQNGRKR